MKMTVAEQPSQIQKQTQLKFSQFNKKAFAQVPAVMLSSPPRAIPIIIWSFPTKYWCKMTPFGPHLTSKLLKLWGQFVIF